MLTHVTRNARLLLGIVLVAVVALSFTPSAVSAEEGDRESQLEAKKANIERKLERAERNGEPAAKIARLRNKLAKAAARLSALAAEAAAAEAVEPPVAEPPAVEPPAVEPPAVEPPAVEPPAVEPPADGASDAESDSAGDAAPKVREPRSMGAVDHTIGAEGDNGWTYTHPPTQADIDRATALQKQADKDFLTNTPGAIRSGAPAWCYEAPGTHGSAGWDQHCAPPKQSPREPLNEYVHYARQDAYIAYMRTALEIQWNADGSVMNSVCHEDPDGDGTYTLIDFSRSMSGILAEECSSVGVGAWWRRS